MQDTISIDLDKRVEDITILLEKRGIKSVPATRVGLALDISGSTSGLYDSGVMENTVARCLAVASKFDDNGEMDMWAFSEDFSQLSSATKADYGTYVRNKVLAEPQRYFFGGTCYSPVMRAIDAFYFPERGGETPRSLVKRLFGAKQAPQAPQRLLPAHVLFITDGRNESGDDRQVMNLLEQTQGLPVYWNMVGVGPAHEFWFLEKLASRFGHVGFVSLSDLTISDEDLYDKVLGDEFVAWVRKLST